MKLKNVLLLLFSEYLGTESRSYLMLRSLKKFTGCRVWVIAWDRDGNSPDPSGYEGVVDHWLWVRLPSPTASSKLILKIPQYYYKLRRIAADIEQPDLVIFPHFFQLPLSFLLPGKKIYDAFEMYSLELSLYFGPLAWLARPCLDLVEGLLASRMDGVLTLDSLSGQLEHFYRKWNEKVEVIWNLTAKEDDPEESAVMALADRYAGRKVIVLAGNLHKEQGLWVSLEAAPLVVRTHPDALFVFMGYLKEDPAAVQNLIRTQQLEGHVSFLDFMPYRQMLSHLRHAQIALMPYLPQRNSPFCSLGNSRKSFTYLQAGLPIIGPDFGECGLLLKQENCGLLVDPTHPEELARSINYLLENPGEAKAMGERGRRAFEERYNWKREQVKFIQFIEGIERS